MGGFDATSNVLASQLYHVPVAGTHAHAFVSSFAQGEERILTMQKYGFHVFAPACSSEAIRCLFLQLHQPIQLTVADGIPVFDLPPNSLQERPKDGARS